MATVKAYEEVPDKLTLGLVMLYNFLLLGVTLWGMVNVTPWAALLILAIGNPTVDRVEIEAENETELKNAIKNNDLL